MFPQKKRLDFIKPAIIVAFCLAHYCYCGDFSGDEDYEEEVSDYNPFFASYHPDEVVKAKNLTANKIHDFLLDIDSHIFTNNEVLTVKDRDTNSSLSQKSSSNHIASTVKNFKKPIVDIKKINAQAVIYSKKSYLKEDVNSKLSHADKLDSSRFIQSDQPQWQHYESTPQSFGASVSEKSANSGIAFYSTRVPNYKMPEPSRTPEPTNQANLWNCEFKAFHDCGIVNDLSVGNFFQLENRNFFNNFNWKSWYLMLNTSLLSNQPIGARLITPYIETNNVPQGCLSLHYITAGSGVKRVTLYQQDQDNYCIWSSMPRASTPDKLVNNQFDFTIDLRRGSPRFFIELHLDLGEPIAKQSIFALANVRMVYRPCFNDNSNLCQVRVASKPKPPQMQIP